MNAGEQEVQLALQTASELMADFLGFTIQGADDLAKVSGILKEAKARGQHLASVEKSITDPMNEALRKTKALFTPARARFAEIEKLTKGLIAEFHARQAAHNAAAEAEMVRALEEEKPAAIVMQSVAKIASVKEVDNVSVRSVWDFEVVDALAVPREFLMVNESALRAHLKQHKDVVPVTGVRFFQKSVVAVRT